MSEISNADSEPNADRSSILAQFLQITQIQEQDAVGILESCGWKLEEAVTLYLTNLESSVSEQHVASSSCNTKDNNRSIHFESQFDTTCNKTSVRRRKLVAQESETQENVIPQPEQPKPHISSAARLYILVCVGLVWVFTWCKKLTSYMTNFIRLIIHILLPSSFGDNFSEKFSDQKLNFFIGGLYQAAQEAAKRSVLLAIYLHKEQPDDCFLNMIHSDQIRTLLNDDTSFVLWGHHSSPPINSMFRNPISPSLTVVIPKDISVIIQQVNKYCSVEELQNMLVECKEVLQSRQHLTQNMEQQRILDRQLKEDQDREYAEALLLDSQKKEQRMKEQKEKQEMQKRIEDEERRLEVKKQKLKVKRQQLAIEFRQRDTEDTENEIIANESNKTKICLRLPSGTRFSRMFSNEDTVSYLYDWAIACPELYPEKLTSNEELATQFVLTTPWNSAALDKSSTKSLACEGLTPNALLLLIPNDDDT